MATNKIAVGIICNGGETPENLEAIHRIKKDRNVANVIPVFGHVPTKFRGKYIYHASANHPALGPCRNMLLKTLTEKINAQVYAILGAGVKPDGGYFEYFAWTASPAQPTLYTAKLKDNDGNRTWDVCTLRTGAPAAAPYEFCDHPDWAPVYFDEDQHVFNRSGAELAVRIGYPAEARFSDVTFCRQFSENEGRLQFLPEISATMLSPCSLPAQPLFLPT